MAGLLVNQPYSVFSAALASSARAALPVVRMP